MAGYIGSKASVVSSGVEHKKTFTITGATTSLTGLNYTVGKVHVFQNGVRLVDGTDYTATNSTTITLTVAAQSGDNVVVISQASYQVALSGIDDQSNATAITIDSSENVGIGTSSPTVINTGAGIVLDVANTATTGTTADNAEIVLRSTSRFTGLTFKTPNDKASTINFGDTDDSDVGIIQYNHANNAMSFTANASERLRVDSDGLKFNGDTAAANALDDYEEGEFDVAFETVGGSITLNGSFNRLAYTKIGKLVTISGRVNVSGVSNPSGYVRITLPFTVQLGSEHAGYSAMHAASHAVNLGSGIGTFWEVATNSAYAYYNILYANASWVSDASIFTSGGNQWVYISGTYLTNQ